MTTITEEQFTRLKSAISQFNVVGMDLPVNGIYYHLVFTEDELEVEMPYIGNELWMLGNYPRQTVSAVFTTIEDLNEFLTDLKPCKWHNFGDHPHGYCSAELFCCTETDTCAICMETSVLTQLVPVRCGHRYHLGCLNELAKSKVRSRFEENPDLSVKCPVCRFTLAIL